MGDRESIFITGIEKDNSSNVSYLRRRCRVGRFTGLEDEM